jgi:hypothetical protein
MNNYMIPGSSYTYIHIRIALRIGIFLIHLILDSDLVPI